MHMYNCWERLLLGGCVDSCVQLLLLLQRVDVFVGGSRVALGVVEDLSTADGVFETGDLVWGLVRGKGNGAPFEMVPVASESAAALSSFSASRLE